jgi:hypothetical protein
MTTLTARSRLVDPGALRPISYTVSLPDHTSRLHGFHAPNALETATQDTTTERIGYYVCVL